MENRDVADSVEFKQNALGNEFTITIVDESVKKAKAAAEKMKNDKAYKIAMSKSQYYKNRDELNREDLTAPFKDPRLNLFESNIANDPKTFNTVTLRKDLDFQAVDLLIDVSDTVPLDKEKSKVVKPICLKRDAKGRFIRSTPQIKIEPIEESKNSSDDEYDADDEYDVPIQKNQNSEKEKDPWQGPSKTKYLKAIQQMEINQSLQLKCPVPGCATAAKGTLYIGTYRRNRHIAHSHPEEWKMLRPHLGATICVQKLRAMDEAKLNPETGEWSCVICNKTWGANSNHHSPEGLLVNHIETVHYGLKRKEKKKYECHICGSMKGSKVGVQIT